MQRNNFFGLTLRFLQQIYDVAQRELQPISLKNLLDFGANLSELVLVHSAQWLWNEIPGRLARQGKLMALRSRAFCIAKTVVRLG